jgi:hypothetical protein
MNINPMLSDSPEQHQKPNDILALQITESLVDAGLIRSIHKEQLLAKLKNGGVKQEDWYLWIDMATTTKEMPSEVNDE